MIAAIIPALNAAETLPLLLKRLAAYVEKSDTFVVDDGSTDSTAEIAEIAHVRLVRHNRNLGKGAALRTGFARTLEERRYSAVLTLDADLQHSPDDVPAFLKAHQQKEADILIGWRKKLGTGMPLHRVFSNVITSALVSARAGTRIRDSQSGFRLISAEVCKAVVTSSDGFEAETEFLIRAAKQGFSIGFVPIATIYGNAGSHMTHWHTTKQFIHVLLRKY